MNLIKLQNEIADDEGVKYETYRCSEGYPTGGIGHLITEWDEEYYEQPMGTKIPHEQVDDWFAKDIEDSRWFKQTPNRAQRLITRVDRVYARESIA
jgi:GH24 family phage-related lysozyme (muramidase)